MLAKKRNNRRPTHPGEIIKEMYLRPLGLTQEEFAKAFKTSPQYWLNLQSAVDLYDAERKHHYQQVRCLTAA